MARYSRYSWRIAWLSLAMFALGASAKLFATLFEAPARIVPLTAHYTRILLGDPVDSGSNEVQITYARRGDGSIVSVMRFSRNEGSISEIRHITDYGKGKLITLESSTRSMMTVRSEAPTPASYPRLCGGVKVESTILGYEVVRRAQEGSQHRYVSFHAPELGCAKLGARVYRLLDAAENHYELVQEDRVDEVIVGDPDEDLFSVGQDYTERSPAELVTMMAGGEINEDLLRTDAFVQMAEENYYRRQ